MAISKDPVMLLSYINTQLRDNYSSLDDLCKSLDLSEAEIKESLIKINYEYDQEKNQFI